ncbi:hypothetical protein ACFVKB_34930 [Rhodococcus sp. NPDC127530]|uniref:hypothetical protein n=1 Tax=unclassified Rhodococcus (in: high G+C Gram-positive bacteria) TaxID=192944 RepID=UPI00363F3BC3
MAIDYTKKNPATAAIPTEPPPGSVIRFNIGYYTYAAYRVDDEEAWSWWTTSAEDYDEDSEWGGVSRVDTWEKILEASGGAIEIAETWRKL